MNRSRLIALLAIALISWALAMIPRTFIPSSALAADDFFYDYYYRTRPIASQENGNVVIISADELSLQMLAQPDVMDTGWPWPRADVWGRIVKYLDKQGAKVIVFDIVFPQTSSRGSDDDKAFAAEMSKIKTPVIFANLSDISGWGPFAPHIDPPAKFEPVFGAANINDEKISRRYNPIVEGRDSLALAAVKAAGITPKIPTDSVHLLHYYGPHQDKGVTTYPFIRAVKVFQELVDDTPNDFYRGKIIVLGTSAVGTYDLKSSPISAIYPGVEVQATAISNFLSGDAVHPVSTFWRAAAPLLLAFLVAGFIIIFRNVSLKLVGIVLALAIIFGVGILLFRSNPITFFAPTDSFLAVAIATPAALGWTYLAEDRQRRFMLKALSKVVSPAVAEQLAANPQSLQLGTVRTEVTLIFTDLANFTDLSESMTVEALGKLLNRYLGEMSDQVFAQNGTLDKYIGDAVMCFWNAPMPQSDHAAGACRAALAMAKREREIAAEIPPLPSGKRVFTRIGVNTTPAAVGFVGSSHLFNYTCLGDGVNLASRLEGANKIYGTQILVSENTVTLVKNLFVFRKLDTLRVKGKKQPMGVYELIAEAGQELDTAEVREKAALYEAALAAYQVQKWDEAEKTLLELSQKFGQDAPATILLGRVHKFRENPPGSQWDGVYVASEK